MKKSIISLTLSLVCVLSSMAITFPFSVNVPKFKGVAVSNTNGGVNIRKTPSATAPRLIVDESKIENYDAPAAIYGFWASKPMNRNQYAITFYGPDLIVNEQNGWLEMYNIGPKMKQNGWVSAKYCKTFPLKPLTPATYGDNDHFMWLAVGDNGQELYALIMEYSVMDSYAMFYVGRVVDGVVVCPYSLYVNCEYSESSKCRLGKDGNLLTLFYNSEQSPDDCYNLKLNLLPIDILQEIIQLTEPCKEYIWFDHNMYSSY